MLPTEVAVGGEHENERESLTQLAPLVGSAQAEQLCCSVEVIICMTFDLSVSICGEFYAMSVYDFKESSASRTTALHAAREAPPAVETNTHGW